MKDLILNAEQNGYQALYNIIVRHHPTMTLKNRVQVDIPKQGQKEPFGAHVRSIQYYINTEQSQGRLYTEQEQATLAIKTLQERYRQRFLDKSHEDLTNTNLSKPFPFELNIVHNRSNYGRMGYGIRSPGF